LSISTNDTTGTTFFGCKAYMAGVVVGDDGMVLRVASGSRVLDMPIVPGVTTCIVVEPVREQLVIWVKMVEHKGHVLLESRGDDDAKNDVEEVNAVISGCLPLVYDAGDIIDIKD
jgi:hypothetical protein